MDGRIVGVTENLARTMFKLNPAYEVVKCNVNEKVVDIGLTNGLIPVNFKFPRSIIDDIINDAVSVSDVMSKCSNGHHSDDSHKESFEAPSEDSEPQDNNSGDEANLEKAEPVKKPKRKLRKHK